MLRRSNELNKKIDEKANSVNPEDMEMVNLMKQEVQDLEDERNTRARLTIRTDPD